jgi:hypothetical protein
MLTFAETAPDPKDYPGALPHMIFAGSLVFTPPKYAVDLSAANRSQFYRQVAEERLAKLANRAAR